MAQARTIVETPQVAADRDAAQLRYPRFEEAWEGWTWRIARGPDGLYAVPGFPNFYIFKSHSGFSHYGVPETKVLFRILDANTIEVTALCIA